MQVSEMVRLNHIGPDVWVVVMVGMEKCVSLTGGHKHHSHPCSPLQEPDMVLILVLPGCKNWGEFMTHPNARLLRGRLWLNFYTI